MPPQRRPEGVPGAQKPAGCREGWVGLPDSKQPEAGLSEQVSLLMMKCDWPRPERCAPDWNSVVLVGAHPAWARYSVCDNRIVACDIGTGVASAGCLRPIRFVLSPPGAPAVQQPWPASLPRQFRQPDGLANSSHFSTPRHLRGWRPAASLPSAACADNSASQQHKRLRGGRQDQARLDWWEGCHNDVMACVAEEHIACCISCLAALHCEVRLRSTNPAAPHL